MTHGCRQWPNPGSKLSRGRGRTPGECEWERGALNRGRRRTREEGGLGLWVGEPVLGTLGKCVCRGLLWHPPTGIFPYRTY